MSKVFVRQLGNGTAFLPDQPNTAFTLFDDRVLVDCGYNIFSVLLTKKDENGEVLANKIEKIFITHWHDDHIGSLATFIYWNEFVNKFINIGGRKLEVYLPREVYKIIHPIVMDRYIYPRQTEFIRHVKIYNIDEREIENPIINRDDLLVRVRRISRRTHGHHRNTSYIFECYINDGGGDVDKVVIMVTGDTKASKHIQDEIREIMRDNVAYVEDYVSVPCRTRGLVVFHDFSHFNSLDNIHACELDFENVYDDWFKKYIVKVHTGDKEFKEIWTLEDIPEFVEEG